MRETSTQVAGCTPSGAKILPMRKTSSAPGHVDETPASRRARRRRRTGVHILALLVLGLVFASYFDRDMMFTLATQAWGCL